VHKGEEQGKKEGVGGKDTRESSKLKQKKHLAYIKAWMHSGIACQADVEIEQKEQAKEGTSVVQCMTHLT